MHDDKDDTLFLPDFCDIRMVFAVVLAGQLLALVLALVPVARWGDSWEWWQRLGLLSVFIQWLGLSSAGVLCIGRRWLRGLGDVSAGIASYALVLLVCATLSELAYWLIASRLVQLEPVAWANLYGSKGGGTQAHLEFLGRNVSISAIVAAVTLRYLYVQHQWKRRLELETRARIQALQSRIRPHFLFNCMNTIASLTRSQPAMAEQITEDLAELFRESLSDAGVPTTLGREIEICRQYLRIEEQRLGDRLRVRWDVDSLPEDALLPRLSLQPLLENAVYHGIEPSAVGGEVAIHGQRNGSVLRLSLTNPLPDALAPGAIQRKGNQLAQSNVSERLQAFFGSRASVVMHASESTYEVVIELPVITELP